MRYRELHEFISELESQRDGDRSLDKDKDKDRIKSTDISRLPHAQSINKKINKPSNTPVNLPSNTPDNSSNNSSAIERFINKCIPEELSKNEKSLLFQWLKSQFTEMADFDRHNSNTIKKVIRGALLGRGIQIEKLLSTNIDNLIHSMSDSVTSFSDEAAITRLIGISKRLSRDVIVTPMSDLSDDSINIRQLPYDILADYIGVEFDAKSIESDVINRFHLSHGIFLIFRNIQRASVYVNILIDTDRRIIRGGKDFNNLTRLTRQNDHLFNSDKLKIIVIDKNSSIESKHLFDVTDRYLDRVQDMLNSDQILEIYDMFGIHYEKDIVDQLTKRDDDKINRIQSV